MYLSCLLALALTAPVENTTWLTSYTEATDLAMQQKKDLVIYFAAKGELDSVLANPEVAKKLDNFVCLKVPTDYKVGEKKLLDYAVLGDMMGKPGLAVISYQDKKLSTFATVISAHPITGSRYGWVPAYGPQQVIITLDLPAFASLSQRSMIYAVRVHPEVPQSVFSVCHPAFLEHARNHSTRQASSQRQHHADILAASGTLRSKVEMGFSGTQEVVAESWGRFVGGENVLEAAFSCIDAWRHSSGHWGAVARRHTYFGYDIAQGANGTWYATGIFGQ